MKTYSFRSVIAVVTLLAGIVVPGASAQDDTAALVGTGTISPGLPTIGCSYQEVAMSLTADVVGDHSGIYVLYFDAFSNDCESILSGSGDGTFSGDGTGYASYSRTAQYVSLVGYVVLANVVHSITDAVCQIVWTSYNPVGSYTFVCPVVLLST